MQQKITWPDHNSVRALKGVTLICLTLKTQCFSLFIDFNVFQSKHKYFVFVFLQVSIKDHLPKQICQKCVDNLDKTHSFVLSVIAAEEAMESLVFLW